jgi:mRNA interferase RelE/StbE
MRAYRIRFTPEASQCISRLHPSNKKIIKNALDELRNEPYAGDDLQDEFAGFKSLKPKRFRIIYTVEEERNEIRIYYVGHRRDIYDQFRLLLTTLEP